ncbi:MAG: hypothetical protein WCX83_04245 [Candidatus Cloacimonas sp.]|nr:hypothetical protein [Candidatus Cloacimonadota bacterium]
MRIIVSSLLILLLSVTLFADVNSISVNLSGQQHYNVLRISSFDTNVPENQPEFFRLTIRNNENVELNDVYLRFKFLLNDDLLVDSRSRYKPGLQAGETLILTNRDIFVDADSPLFSRPEPKISPADIMDKIPKVRDVVFDTGLFPDGKYTFTVQFEERDHKPLSPEASHTFRIKNPSGIFLVRPGNQLGGKIPTVSDTPLTFIWSSNLAGASDTKFRFVLKEFDDPYMVTPGFVETGGMVLADVDGISDTYYSGYIPFKDGRYYAWQVSANLIDPAGRDATAILKSNYNIFTFKTQDEMTDTVDNEAYMDFLMSLRTPLILQFIADGYLPTGEIEYNGVVYRGADAEALLNELLSRTIKKVEVTD